MDIVDESRKVIRENNLYDWFADYPWMTGYLGDPLAPVWFIGENPSLSGVEAVNMRSPAKSENLQWNSHAGDRLLREAITEAGLKLGAPEADGGWRCYITNVIKEPEIVAVRNKKKRDARYWQSQADRWQPLLQRQIETGNPQVLLALGGQAFKILRHMVRSGRHGPIVEKIHHYSYIMRRPEARTRRGPGHPDRILEFKNSILILAKRYDS